MSWMQKRFRAVLLASLGLVLAAGLATADPRIFVEYRSGIPEIRLDGNYAGSRYTVFRSDRSTTGFAAISTLETLCTGECFVHDFDAAPGATYWYRFDLQTAEGAFVSFGPYAVQIASPFARPVAARVSPNPGGANARVELFLGGSPSAAAVDVTAELHDLQGRALRTFHRGPLARGITRIDWDGRDRAGRPLGVGIFYLRFSTPLGTTVTRVIRTR